MFAKNGRAPTAVNCPNCGQTLEENAAGCGKCGYVRPERRDGDEPTFVRVRLNDVLDGKWRLEKKIGEGGMGTVYLAHDLQLDRPVAVKILSRALVGDEEITTRFEREARLTASLEHPNIVPVYAVGRVENRPFMVMKKLEGQTLAELLREKGGLTLDETMALMAQLASGLDFIHAKGYVHRDIKAGNIFLGPDGHATILDFGILRPSKSGELLTRTGVVMGTPQYMSPEQALGIRDVDHRADLYALAVVLFECLTGTLPFEADSELQIIQMQAHAPPPDLVQRAPWIPPTVADVVTRALAKRPEDRFASGGELLQALEAARLSAGASHARPLPPSSPAGQTPLTSPSWRQVAKASLGSVVSRPPGQLPPASSASPTSEPPRSMPTVAERSGSTPHQGPDTGELVRSVRSRRSPVLVSLALVLLASGAAAVTLWPKTLPSAEVSTEENTQEEWALDLTAEADAGDEDVGEAFDMVDGGDVADEEVAENDEPDAGPAVEPTPRKRARKGTGKLNVITTHRGEPYWAEVSINGVPKGRTPLLLELPVGKHKVRVDRMGFRSEERQIKVASGRPRVLRIALTQ
ncbi:MAG: protein kinase domain-containing protein [Myxococcota bacterium]